MMRHVDRSTFMEKLTNAREIGIFELYAYCLMKSNHVHLLIKEAGRTGNQHQTDNRWLCINKQIWSHRASLFRIAEQRSRGDDSSPMTVVRYIHRNPIKAGIACLEEYP